MQREEKYPWLDWFTGEDKELKKGVNFFNSVYDFRNQIRQANNRYLEKYPDKVKRVGISVVDNDTILLTLNNQQQQLVLREVDKPVSNFRIKQNSFQIQYPKVAQLFLDIERGGEEVYVDKPLKDEDGKPILKINLRDAEGNRIYLPGQVSNKELATERVKILKELPEEVILYYPNDISISPKQAAGKIRNAAVAWFAGVDNVDPTKWYYEFTDTKLTIKYGKRGLQSLEYVREKENNSEKSLNEPLKQIIPVTYIKLVEWLDRLKASKRLDLIRGKDYSCSDAEAAALLYKHATDAGIRLYEAVLTAENGRVTVNINSLDQTALFGAGYDEQYVNRDYLEVLANNNEIKSLEELIELETVNNKISEESKAKIIQVHKDKIAQLIEDNTLLNSQIDKVLLQPSDLAEIERLERLEQLEEEKKLIEKEEKKLIKQQPKKTYNLSELQEKLTEAKRKNNAAAIKFFEKKIKDELNSKEHGDQT